MKMKCQRSTTKKAWANPLAPMADCTLNAVATASTPPEWSWQERAEVCRIHAKALTKRGWIVTPYPPESKP